MMMIKEETYHHGNSMSDEEKALAIRFLSQHLEGFGDPIAHITKATDYALQHIPSPGGFVLVARDPTQIVGVVVVNKTGMGGYIPENILVYIAVHSDYRGRGVGLRMMQKALAEAEGDVALHVEPDNPALHLYQRLGFTNKYLEMRYSRLTGL